MTKLRFPGLDVHAETIAVAIAEPGGEVRSIGTIPNRLESIRKMIGKLGPVKELRACYEAGPTGYVLYWQLTQLGVECQVIAPTLVPVKAGDRVKTDRQDAEKLARCHRAGDLTAVWVPDEAHEALRDLVRAREAGKKDQLRDYFHEVEHAAARIERLEKAFDEAISKAPEQIRAVIEALQALRGVAQLTAATIVSEIGSFSRFEPRKLMGYSGLVASEHSSGNRLKKGAITKTGNAHLRRVIVEAAWSYQRRPWIGGYLLRRQRNLNLSEEAKEIGWKAQYRLHNRYMKLTAGGKNKNQTVTAVGRELLGFIWDIAVRTERAWEQAKAA